MGYKYLPLHDLLREVDILITCLNKNVLLLHDEEFAIFGDGKIIVNTSIGPSFDLPALKKWLENEKNWFFCDTLGALGAGEEVEALAKQPNVSCMYQSSGMSAQAVGRLGVKVLDNIRTYLKSVGEL